MFDRSFKIKIAIYSYFMDENISLRGYDVLLMLFKFPSAASIVSVSSEFLFFSLFVWFLLFMLKIFLKCLILGSICL